MTTGDKTFPELRGSNNARACSEYEHRSLIRSDLRSVKMLQGSCRRPNVPVHAAVREVRDVCSTVPRHSRREKRSSATRRRPQKKRRVILSSNIKIVASPTISSSPICPPPPSPPSSRSSTSFPLLCSSFQSLPLLPLSPSHP